MGKKERDFCPFLFPSAVYGSPSSPPSSIPSPPSSPPYYSSTQSSSHYCCSSASITSPFVHLSTTHPLSPATATSSPAGFGANITKFQQFKRGLEEASTPIPTATQLVVDLESHSFANGSKEDTTLLAVKKKKVERPISPDDGPSARENRSACGKARAIKPRRYEEIVDLESLLMVCARAVSGNDFRKANELLKQIRQHSSPTGNGSQRLAHYFANALEARLVGSGAGLPNFYMNLASERTTVADKLNAYRTRHSCCPFENLSFLFATKMILHAAEKSKKLHVIDFGILYGFQWPSLIRHLSIRVGELPKLRITGIELPEPMETIEESGRRLARYCERFHVPFEYNPIAAQNWESIPIEDLKIRTDEVLAVNCIGRFKNLLDETVEVDCPRNAVLDLIRKIKPNIFVHTVINGSYNTPFFVTRFREALFHFSSMFDMFDSTLPREDEGRMTLENEIYEREAINVVACEGVERVERPEVYKQWQVRNTRAGFKQLPLDQETMEKCREKLKCYNKDFVLEEDNNWMLQGWKGRIIYASSCWVPA